MDFAARFGARERRVAAIGILVVLLGLAYLAIVAPIVRGFAERADARTMQVLRFQRNERLIASIPRLRRIVEAQEPQRRRFVLAAADEAEARDYLQERLRSLVAGLGSDLATTEAVENPVGASPGSVGGTAAISGTARLSYAQLLQLMPRIQNEEPFVQLDALSVVANQAIASGQLDTLDVKIDIAIRYAPAARR